MVAPIKKPTICHLLHSLHVGGAEVLAARLARRFAAQYRVVFACLDGLGPLGEDLRREGFTVPVFDRRPGLDWRCAGRLSRFFRDERVDVVHAHQYTPFFYAALGRALGRRPNILFTEHGRSYPDRRRPRRVLSNRLLLHRRDRVVGVGAAVRRALIDYECLPAGRVGVVFNGIDLGPYRAPRADSAEVRREIGVGPSDPVILQVARLDYLKDHPTALRAMKRVAQVVPEARLLLAGDGPCRADIERHIAELGLADHVRLLGTRRDVPRLLAAADVFLLSSISEGIPLTLIEALAAGVPVVATNVGGVGEVIEHEVTGLLAPAGDDAALADHLVRLARHPQQREGMGRTGSRRAFDMFTEEQMHASYGRHYQEMCHG